MTRSPAGPNPAQWGRREPVSFGTGCTGDCVSSRPSDGPGSHVPAALEEIRERNTHRQSASNPYGRRRFVNFVVLDASEPYFTKSELRLRIPELLAKPVNRPVEWNSARGMRRIQEIAQIWARCYGLQRLDPSFRAATDAVDCI